MAEVTELPCAALLSAAKRMLTAYGKGDKEESEALLDLVVAVDQLERRLTPPYS